MSNKGKVWYFIVCAALGITFLPIMNFHKFIENYDWKELFVTDRLEGYINYALYKTLDISLEQDSVIVGKDNFLFLGNKYANVLHKTNGVYPLNIAQVNRWVDNLQHLQQWYEDRGIMFILAIAPNKHSVYREMLPDWISGHGHLTDTIVDSSREKGIHILDLRETIIPSKSEGLLYYKTDTHWNRHGASIGYAETLNSLNMIYNAGLTKAEIRLNETRRKSGDLASFLKINDLLGNDYDLAYKYVLGNDLVCEGDIDKNTGSLKECIKKANVAIGINNQPKYVVNDASLNKQKLLLLRDSFGTLNSQLYSATFQTTWSWHHSHIRDGLLIDFIQKNKPDIVIYQIVERGLFDMQLVTPPASKNAV